MPKHRIFAPKLAGVYPLYVQKAERKNRTREEVDQIIYWLTGYNQARLEQQIEQEKEKRWRRFRGNKLFLRNELRRSESLSCRRTIPYGISQMQRAD